MSRTAEFDTRYAGRTRGEADPAEIERGLRELDGIARLMDARFGIPGFRFGLDSVIGLVPGIGDAAGGLISAYLIYRAHQLGADSHIKAKMVQNAGFDFALGLVPVVGDIGDVFFKANTHNVRLLTQHLKEKHGAGMIDITPPTEGQARRR